MKALRLHGIRDIRYEDVPEPSPGADQIKVKVKLAGICGSDVNVYVNGPYVPDKVPIILGHEFLGEIVEIGKDVTGFQVGDRVTALGSCWYCGECLFCKQLNFNLCLNLGATGVTESGCMAEYMVAPARTFHRLPDRVSDDEGALVEPLCVAFHGVGQGGVKLGDRVAVVGDGIIGLCAVLGARALGAAEVYMVAKHKGRGQKALEMGASKAIYLEEGDPSETILTLTEGLGVDVALECAGRPETPQLAASLLRKNGICVIVGAFHQPSTFDFMHVMMSQIKVVGSILYVNKDIRGVIALLADKRIDPTGLISGKVPLKDAKEKGFEKLIADKKDTMKMLIEIA